MASLGAVAMQNNAHSLLDLPCHSTLLFSTLARPKFQQASKKEVKSMICEMCYTPKELFEFYNLYREIWGHVWAWR